MKHVLNIERPAEVPFVSSEEASGIFICYARIANREKEGPLSCISFENASATVVLDVEEKQKLIGIEIIAPYSGVESSDCLKFEEDCLDPVSIGEIIVDDEVPLSVTIAKESDSYRIHCINPSTDMLTLKTINLAGVQLFVDLEYALHGFQIIL